MATVVISGAPLAYSIEANLDGQGNAVQLLSATLVNDTAYPFRMNITGPPAGSFMPQADGSLCDAIVQPGETKTLTPRDPLSLRANAVFGHGVSFA